MGSSRKSKPKAKRNVSNKAKACKARGKSDSQIASSGSVLPKKITANINKAADYFNAGRNEDAKQLCLQILDQYPDQADTLHTYGLVIMANDEYALAEQYFRKAVQLSPDKPAIYNSLGLVFEHFERFAEAEEIYNKVLQMKPDFAEVYNNLGKLFNDTGRASEGVENCKRALQYKPDFLDAFLNLGIGYRLLGKMNKSRNAYREVLRLDPDHAKGHLNLAHNQLALKELSAGWESYQWRFRVDPDAVINYPYPEWDGSALTGKSILVYAEQGIGDEIMYVSCLPDLIKDAELCVVGCDPRLRSLFARSFPDAVFFNKSFPADQPETGNFPQIDFKVPVGSLPRYYRRNLEEFPECSGYLLPEKHALEKWRVRYSELGNSLKVGLSWRGGNINRDKLLRSIELTDWVPLLKIPGITFINLQYGDCTAELVDLENSHGVRIVDWDDADPLKDMDDFAAQIAALDIVISIDNSTVHMAGALGTPVWVILPDVTDWRWFLEGDTSVWYQSIRLFRNKKGSSWESVFAKVKSELMTLYKLSDSGETLHQDNVIARPVEQMHAGDNFRPSQTKRKKIAFLNDTTDWCHWGCTCTSTAIRDQLVDNGVEVMPIPAEDIRECINPPGDFDQFDDVNFFRDFATANREMFEVINDAELVVINGEGVLHGISKTAINLLYIAYVTRVFMRKPVHIINHSCYPEDRDTGESEPAKVFYRKVYEAIDGVVIRESISADLIGQLGIKVVRSFDCLPLYIDRHYLKTKTNNEQGKTKTVVITGSEAISEHAFPAVCEYIKKLVADGYVVNLLSGAKDNLSNSDLKFREALRYQNLPGWNLIIATSAEKWLDTIECADLLVSGRFHHSIAAAFLQTPLIAIESNTPKIRALMNMLGLEQEIQPDQENFLEILIERTERILGDPSLALVSEARLNELKELSMQNFAGLQCVF